MSGKQQDFMHVDLSKLTLAGWLLLLLTIAVVLDVTVALALLLGSLGLSLQTPQGQLRHGLLAEYLLVGGAAGGGFFEGGRRLFKRRGLPLMRDP